MQRMWILRRMKTYNLSIESICDTYVKEKRSILELAFPVWHSGLTQKQNRDIERVQKIALLILLGDHFVNYEVACSLKGIEPLNMRREQLCLNFAEKNVKLKNSLFIKAAKTSTRCKDRVVVEPKSNFKRFRNSSIPFLSRLLNSNV